MAEQKATTEQAPASDGAPQQATGASTPARVTDLGMVDEKVLQSAIDREVRKALKTREENLNAEKVAAIKKQEQDAAMARGEFDKVRASLEAERDQFRQRATALELTHELKLSALQAGINDPDDVRLLGNDVLASLTDERGAVNRDAVKAAVEQLRASKAYLFKPAQATQTPQPVGQPSPGSAVPATPAGDLTADHIAKFRSQLHQRVTNPAGPSSMDLLRELLSGKH